MSHWGLTQGHGRQPHSPHWHWGEASSLHSPRLAMESRLLITKSVPACLNLIIFIITLQYLISILGLGQIKNQNQTKPNTTIHCIVSPTRLWAAQTRQHLLLFTVSNTSSNAGMPCSLTFPLTYHTLPSDWSQNLLSRKPKLLYLTLYWHFTPNFHGKTWKI